MRAISLACMLVGTAARADDGPALHDAERPALLRDADEALLHLDPLPIPVLRAVDAAVDKRGTTVAIGRRSWVELENTTWSGNVAGEQHGWSTGVRAAYRFHGVQISGSAIVNQIDTPYGSGTYVDYGLSIGVTKRLSRWMTAWIALSVNIRDWQTRPPEGEQDSATVMLTLGTTFK